MPIQPHVMAGENDNNKLHQDHFSYKGTGHLGGHIAIFHVNFGGHLAGHLDGHITIFYVCFGGRLAGCCACASPGEILYILPKLATMSALGSWHVHCLGWVIWWSDRNKQGLLTESMYIYIYIYIYLLVNKVSNALQTCMSL